MRRRSFLFLVAVLTVQLLSGQNPKKYDKFVQEARELRKRNEFLASAKKYSDAFVAYGNRGMWYDRYNAACSWALANEPDSAFAQLSIITRNDFADLKSLTTDSDFESLHADLRWDELVKAVQLNKEKSEASLDKLLVAILDTVYREDQEGRQQLEEVAQQYGYESEEVRKMWKVIQEKDSVNLVKVTRILDERGWLGSEIVGAQGNHTLFLVIQHADLNTQEKYLPMMREAVRRGDAFPFNLALLEDRVALGQGKKQIYGSQIGRNEETGMFYVFPLEDPARVNKRRSDMGLGSIEEYVAMFGIEWSVKSYKKQLKELEKSTDSK